MAAGHADERPSTVRLWSTDVMAFVYVTLDSRHIILPRTKGNQITGWVLYDSEAGQLYQEKPTDQRRVWSRLNHLRTWLDEHREEEKSDAIEN